MLSQHDMVQNGFTMVIANVSHCGDCNGDYTKYMGIVKNMPMSVSINYCVKCHVFEVMSNVPFGKIDNFDDMCKTFAYHCTESWQWDNGTG